MHKINLPRNSLNVQVPLPFPSLSTSLASPGHEKSGAEKLPEKLPEVPLTKVGGAMRKRLLGEMNRPEQRGNQSKFGKISLSELPRKIGPEDLAGLVPALAKHLSEQSWFSSDKPIASIDIASVRQFPSSEKKEKLMLLGVDVCFAEGAEERWLAPVLLDEKNAIADAFGSQALKDAVFAASAKGENFEADAKAPRRLAPQSDAAKSNKPGWFDNHIKSAQKPQKFEQANISTTAASAKQEAGALERAINGIENNKWSALIKNGYTSPARFKHVAALTKKLSPENSDALLVTFFHNVLKTRETQPAAIQEFQKAIAARPKFSPVFYGYTQFMGVPDEKSEGTFDDLSSFLDVIQGPEAETAGSKRGLGFNEIELLPFFASPQSDGGYDISDHKKADAQLGGDEAHARFMANVVKRKLKVTSDIVANHVSNEHPWVHALQAGDESMLSRFVVWDDAVKAGERPIDGIMHNVFLHMKGENAGKLSHVKQIFPDNNPDTMIVAEVNGKKHNIYASYMNPDQWDVNVTNPDVLSYFLETIGHFANLGQMGTRVDAPLRIGKRPGTYNVNLPEAQTFAYLIKAFTSHVAPGSTVLPEITLPWNKANEQWLAPEADFDGTTENIAGDALIGFLVHHDMWDSLLKFDKTAWIKGQAALGELPDKNSLLAYLGLHDETRIVDPALLERLKQEGATEFAGRGVGESTAELLGNNPDRLAMAHVLLYASKGHPAVYYRTLVGASSDKKFFQTKVLERLGSQKAAGLDPNPQKAMDARDLDRGPIKRADYEYALSEGFKPAITVRALNSLWNKHGAVRTNAIEEVRNPDIGVMSLARKATDSDDPPLLQLINITGERKTVELDLKDIEHQLGWSMSKPEQLFDLLRGEIEDRKAEVAFRIEAGKLKIELAPYEALYLQRGDQPMG